MKASSVFRSPLFVKGADIGTTKTLAEADLNKCHQVTAGVVVTIPTPLTMKAQAGDMVMLFNSSAADASVALGAGASFLNHSGSVPLTPGVAVLLVAYSDSAWTIQGIVPATQADIVAGTDVKKFVNAKEHLAFHAADHAHQNKNKIINGNFDIWQRGTGQTTSAYGSADRWACDNNGTTKTASRQAFTLGQTEVPGNPRYYMRHVVNSVAGANNHCVMTQKIEYVKTLAGKKATLSFWAKADAPKSIAIEFAQIFGSGGTPSSTFYGIGSQLVALTTAWAKYTVTVDIPSIAGKTLGTNINDCLAIYFWFDAGSNLATRSTNLGQQSGTFDIAQVQLEEGSVATPFEERFIGDELALCQRYYLVGRTSIRVYLPAGHYASNSQSFSVQLRATPTLTVITPGGYANIQSKNYLDITPNSFRIELFSLSTTGGDVYLLGEVWAADAEL